MTNTYQNVPVFRSFSDASLYVGPVENEIKLLIGLYVFGMLYSVRLYSDFSVILP